MILTRENILDIVISCVADFYNFTPAELTSPARKCTKKIALAKKAICYFNVIFQGPHYRVLMGKLNYGEKTQSRHTRNRKEVLKMRHNSNDYRMDLKEMSDKIKAALSNEIGNDMPEYKKRVGITQSSGIRVVDK